MYALSSYVLSAAKRFTNSVVDNGFKVFASAFIQPRRAG
jgi:hypothetical protein